MPGWDIRVVDDDGNELKKGSFGNVVLKAPLAPTGFRTLWDDPERFYKGYLKRFDGKWIDTGDAGMIDQDVSFPIFSSVQYFYITVLLITDTIRDMFMLSYILQL